MKRQFFFSCLLRNLAMCLIPVLALSLVIVLVTIPRQQQEAQRELMNSLLLIRENLSLLLNDSNKVMNLVENSANQANIRSLLQSSSLNYSGFSVYKSITAQLNAIVNSRDYIDSIYVYVPNTQQRYLTNQGKVFTLQEEPDANWYEECVKDDRNMRLVRRTVKQYSFQANGPQYLTIVEQNSRESVVAVNILASYFRRIFNGLHLKEGQSIVIADQNQLLFSNIDETTASLQLSTIFDASRSQHEIGSYLYEIASLDEFGLSLISFIPRSVAYASLNSCLGILAITGAACILFSIANALMHAQNTSKRLYNMVDLIDAASRRQPLPKIQNPRNDIYGYIMTNIVSTFLKNDYLHMLLEEKKLQSISLELAALQYQINPHFLSNTLQIIDFEVLRQNGKPCHANQMIEQLSDFLQYSLRSSRKEVPLQEEIEATKLYISLMQERFQDKVRVEWDIQPECQGLLVPRLIFQPLIENSIRHGTQGLSHPLTIRFFICLQDGLCHMVITDNGNGISEEKLAELRKSIKQFSDYGDRHIGLQNLNRRLELFFHSNRLMELSRSEEGGFCVTLKLPIS